MTYSLFCNCFAVEARMSLSGLMKAGMLVKGQGSGFGWWRACDRGSGGGGHAPEAAGLLMLLKGWGQSHWLDWFTSAFNKCGAHSC